MEEAGHKGWGLHWSRADELHRQHDLDCALFSVQGVSESISSHGLGGIDNDFERALLCFTRWMIVEAVRVDREMVDSVSLYFLSRYNVLSGRRPYGVHSLK